uniref:ribonuclease H n=1 Tax=Oryzias sinensis TaxID=183150 RepID=A0A8C7X6F1_9TELE
MLQKVKEELVRMEQNDIIKYVIKPTEWCAPMVPVLKKHTGKARICVDLTKLNKSLKRERYILPTSDEITSKLSGATVFSSLDAASGFWQIPLHPDSCELTTFITPFGRYCFKRLPFGITSAPEIFQRKMLETLEGLEGVEVFMDDILVHGATMEEHDARLERVLRRIDSAGLKLNKEKCSLRQNQLRFLGHLIDKSGVRPDPEKVEAINQLTPPQNVQELKRVLGMVNYLGKYIPSLATVGQPLFDLLRTKNAWTWGASQQSAFDNIKVMLTTAPVLTFYDVTKQTAVSADASSYGLGAVLLQLHGEEWRPVAYCSSRLSEAETRYAQIEKECLASVWACEKFDKYLRGLDRFRLETDHRPLVPLVNSRSLDDVPLRCQRLLMRLMRYNPEAVYVPGKTLVVADTLSRCPQARTREPTDMHSEVECYIATIVQSIPASQSRIDGIRAATAKDSELQTVIELVRKGWPEYKEKVPI